MKLIELTQGKFAMVDDEDFEKLSDFKWHAHTRKGRDHTFYARRNGNYRPGNRTDAIYMHRVVMNVSENEMIDHIDRNGLNNQKSNLRITTQSNNKKNSKGFGVSKYKGVYLQKLQRKYKKKNGEISVYYSERWVAQILIDKKYTCIGAFKTEEDAAKAYDEKAKIYHGEFANLNFK